MKNLIYCILLGLFLWPGVQFHLHAQNNPYRIHDSLYIEYKKVLKFRSTPEAVQMAEALYEKARKMGDKKAECIALTVPVNAFFYGSDSAKLGEAVRRLQRVAIANGYLQYYYFAYNNYIYWCLNHNLSLRALNLSKRMQKQAEKDKNDYGVYNCLKAQGYIYYARRDLDTSIKYHKEALDYALNYLPEQDASLNYQRLAELYCEDGQYEKALAYADKGLEVYKTETNRKIVLLEKCRILFEMGREEEFVKLYAQCREEMEKTGKVSNHDLDRLDAYDALVRGDYEAAKKYAGNKLKVLRLIAERSGDYKAAYEYSQRSAYINDSIVRQIQSEDLAEMAVQLGNERMKRVANDLEKKNISLNLANTRLELEQTQALADLERVNAENSELALKNRTLELERARAEMDRQKSLMEEEKLISRNRITLFIIVTVFLFVFICMLGLYVYRRRLMVNRLRRKNQELAEAREQAEASNRMKTQFIHNMSHEIRTPLNAIVGFSQLLATPDSGFSEEEKNEYSHIILHNSELLTTLVNDILDMSSLESEKCTVHIAPCRCNEACRTALNAVRGRLTDEVELHFHTEVPDDYTMDTDEQRLKQVLIHLLTNAAKFTSAGEILLGCSLTERPGKVVFSVADTGPGVSPDKVDIIFNRFTKGDLFKQGAGLGLAICRRVAEVLHGEVLYDRNYTQGARFLFILPVAREEKQTV